jgi:predicted nucleic acid-binding protein
VTYVLDANIAIGALNRIETVQQALAGVPASEVGVPIVALAELYFGAYKSGRRDENLARVRALAGSLTVLPVTDAVADLYGQTRTALERRGLVKTDFDLVIACTALSLKATLVTNDQNLLDGSIANLQTENWLSGTNLL